MARRKPDRGELETHLGYSFRTPDLLERALTHVSASSGSERVSNQRLEFLGDRVLGMAVAEMLYAAFPDATEGELSHRLSDLVRRETCSAMAAAWDVGPQLVSGGKSGARRSGTVLADAAEAIIGAVFLDGGYEAARSLVERSLAGQLASPDRPPRDAKTALNEWSLGSGRGEPSYLVVERSGPDHAPRFVVAARIAGLADATGRGGSKRAAEQSAAQALLMREGVWRENEHAG